MITEKQMRENLLAALWGLFHKARQQQDTQLQNHYVRQMLPHCDRLHVSVIDYLHQQQADLPAGTDPPAPRAPAPAGQLPTPTSVGGFTCAECGRQFTEAARYYGHLSSHNRLKKKGLTAPPG